MIQFLAAIVLLVPQTTRPKATTLSFEIITPQGTGSRVAAQDWGRVFAKLGHTVRVRQQTASDTGSPEPVTQTETKSARRIKATGLLDNRGIVHFGKDKFRVTDTVRLKDWIDNLKKYGVQGDPSGKPIWGLTKDQFDNFFRATAKPLATEVQGMPIEQAVRTMEFPASTPIKWTDDAKKIAASADEVQRELKLYGRGAALAILLNDAGLGFYPERAPSGSVELLIAKRSRVDMWPIGWPPKLSLAKTIPEFYKRVPVSLPNVTLTRVFGAIEANTKIPILIDHYQIKAKGQEFDKMKVEVKPRKMSWNSVIRTVTVKNRLNYDVRVDELGKTFVWVSTQEIIKAGKDRFKAK